MLEPFARFRLPSLLAFPGVVFTSSLCEAPGDTMNQREARMAQIITLKVKLNLTFACLVNMLRGLIIVVDCDATRTQCHVRPKVL